MLCLTGVWQIICAAAMFQTICDVTNFQQCPWEIGLVWAERVGQGEVGWYIHPNGENSMTVSGFSRVIARPWPIFFFFTHFAFLFCSNFLPILLPIVPILLLSHPFCLLSSHVELINGVQYLERSTWHCVCMWHWNAISGHLNQHCLFC